MKLAWLFSGAVALAGAHAAADEVWSRHNEDGNYIYEDDIDGMGVITYPIGDTGLRGSMFVEGLAGNHDARERFTGYWTEPAREGTPACSVSVTDAHGLTTDYWGRIEVLFVDRSFPSEFILLYGYCFEEPSAQVVATPVLAD